LDDWKDGGLSSKFMMSKLKEADVTIHEYVQKDLPEDWSCLWDRFRVYPFDKLGDGLLHLPY
jgi:hypothetical protein